MLVSPNITHLTDVMQKKCAIIVSRFPQRLTAVLPKIADAAQARAALDLTISQFDSDGGCTGTYASYVSTATRFNAANNALSESEEKILGDIARVKKAGRFRS